MSNPLGKFVAALVAVLVMLGLVVVDAGIAVAATPPTVTITSQQHYFSPNGDGSDDDGVVSFCIDSHVTGDGLAQQVVLTVVVTDAGDNAVRTLENGVVHNSGCFGNVVSWDGRNAANTVVANALYTVHIHAQNTDGATSDTTTLLGVDSRLPATLTQPAAGATLTGSTVPFNVVAVSGVTLQDAVVTCNGPAATTAPSNTPGGGSLSGNWSTNGCTDGPNAIHTTVDWLDTLGGSHTTPLADVAVTSTDAPTVVEENPDGDHRYFTPNGDSVEDAASAYFCVDQAVNIDVTVTDSLSQLKRTLESNVPHTAKGCTPGFLGPTDVALWDGRNDANALVPDGTYTIHVSPHNGIGTSAAVVVGVRNGAVATITQPAASSTLTGNVPWKVTPAGGVSVTAASVTCNGASAQVASSDTPAGDGTYGGTWDTSGCDGGSGPVHASADWTDGFSQTHSATPLADVSVTYLNAPQVVLPSASFEHRYITPDGDGYGDTDQLDYCVSQDSDVTTTVTNAAHTVVRTIEDAVVRPASPADCAASFFDHYVTEWDGKNDGGDVVPEGVYTIHVLAHGVAGNGEQTLDVGVSTTPPATVTVPASGAPVSGTIAWTVAPAAGVTVSDVSVTCTGAAPGFDSSGTPDGDGNFSGSNWDTTGCAAGANGVLATVDWEDPFGQLQTSVLPASPFTSANPPLVTVFDPVGNTQAFDPTAGEHGTFAYCVNQDSTVDVTVVNAADVVVRTLENAASRNAVPCNLFSHYTDTWDGKDGTGNVVANGTYTFKVNAHNDYGAIPATQQIQVEARPPGTITTPAPGGTLAGLATMAVTPTSGFVVTKVSFSFDTGGSTNVNSADPDGVWRARVFTGSLVAGATTLRTIVTWTNAFGGTQMTTLAPRSVVIDKASLPIALAADPSNGPAPLGTTITLDTSDPQGRDVSYTVDFGDGSTPAGGTVAAPYPQVSLPHTYAAGTFHVHVTVTNGQGGTANSTIDVISTATASALPHPSLSLDVSSGPGPLPVTATISSTDADSPNLTYGLVWGDGSTAASGALQPTTGTPQTLSHTFTAPGNYTVTLTVSDGTHVSQASAGVNVVASGPPPASITTTLTPSVTTVGPGAVSMPINVVPTEQLKTFGVDVSNAPMLRRAPELENAPMLRRAPLAELASSLDSAPMLRRAPLTSFGVVYPGGWPALLQGTPLADVPLQSLTLGDVLDLLTANPPLISGNSPLALLGIGDLQLEGSPLDAITPAGLQLGATPVMSLVFADGTPWCTKLAAISPHHETCASLGVTSTTTVIALDLRPAAKAVLDAAPLLRRPSIAANATTFANNHAPVVDAHLDEENLAVTRIGDILVAPAVALVPQLAALPVSGIPAGRRGLVVSCTAPINCSTATMGDAATAGKILPAATLTDMQQGLGSVTVGDLAPALPASIEVNDVITGLLDAADFPWESLDLLKAGIQEFAPSHPTVHWVLAFHADGGSGPWTTTAAANLPPGWRILAGSVTVPSNITALGKPALQEDGTGSQLLLTLAGTQAGTSYSIGFDAVPPLALGTNPATATVSVAGGSATSADADVTVAESADPGATPGSATPLAGDVLYFGHIASAGDVDLFSHTPAAGANDGVRLSHLAGDADLVLYGPPTDAAGAGPSAMDTTGSGPATPPLADSGYTGSTQVAQPTGDADLAGISGLTVAASSATQSDAESATAADVHLVEVRSYNGATSSQPYVLRIRETVPPPQPSCPAYARTGGTAGSFPSLPAQLNTIVLVNQQRMGDTYANSDVAAMMTKLGELANPANHGAVIPVESVSAVSTAYSTWNTNPCNSDAANGVVAAIDNIIKQVRATHPELANVVLVGNDDMVPMARLTDATRWGNETTYADMVGATTPLHAALATGHTLSDDPYGDLDPIPWLDRRLYVPDLAVGRLVETPAQITAQVSLYAAASGVLDASSAYSAGYDFMSDGASAVADALTQSLAVANGGTPPTVTSRISGTWSSADLLSDLASGPSVASIDGHFDHNSGLAAAGFTNGTADTFSAAQLAAALPEAARLVFSMGCHAGLSVPDAGESAGAAVDNPAALAARGAVYLAATGYGYGDQVSVGLHERLMTLFAGELDGSMSIGQAAWQAKQQYFAGEGLYGPYDEKVLSSTVLYGLPMWRLTANPTTRPAPSNVSPTDAGGGLKTLDRTITSTFTLRAPTPTGEWFEVNNPAGGTFAPQVTAGRPIEPRVGLDVTAASAGALLPAHGALVTALTTTQSVPGFPAALSRPTLDEAVAEPADTVTDLAFPSTFASLTTATDLQGVPGADGVKRRQQLVVVPGQFLGNAGNGATGRQDLFGSLGVRLYYSGSADDAEPTFDGSSGVVNTAASRADFSAHVTDSSGVVRVLVLYDAGSGWTPLDLSLAGDGSWRGSAPVAGGQTSVRYVVQAVDGAGNVGASTGKGDGLVAAPPTVPGAVSVTLSPVPPASGFYAATPSVRVAGTNGVTYTVTVDGGTPFTYSGPFTPSGLTTGQHTIDVHGNDGGAATKTLRLDLIAPTITASVSGDANAAGWRSTAPTVTFTCADEGSGVAQCPAPVTVSADGRGQVVSGAVTDLAGNGASASVTVDVDTTRPTAGTPSVRPTTPTVGQAAVVTASASDALSGLVGGEWFVGTDPGVGKGKPMTLSGGVLSITSTLPLGTHVVGVRSLDAAGHWSLTAARSVTVLPVPKVLVSPRATRLRPVALSGRRLLIAHAYYIFVRPPAHTRRVRFWLDDPRRLHKPRRVDILAPFDFVGNKGKLALPYLPKYGAHALTIEVMSADKSIYVMTVKFRAARTATALTPRFARLD